MNTVKADILRLIQELPDNCTIEDIKYRIYLRERIEEGLTDVEAGNELTQAEVDEEVASWLKSSGRAAQ
jgi:predicted transcriptional regulator